MHFPLHPETPPEGLLLADYFANSSYDFEAASARLEALMKAEGLPYDRGDKTYNSRRAQELACWAVEAHGAEEIHDRLFRAYFAQRRDISDTQELVGIAEEAGLDPQQARGVLDERTFRHRVDDDWALSRRMGVTGVPTFAIGGQGVVGAQPYEVLESLAREAGVPPRS